jgi:hypothetical protein
MEENTMENKKANHKEKTWDSLPPKELRNIKILLVVFVLVSLLAFIVASKIMGLIFLAFGVLLLSGPFGWSLKKGNTIQLPK